jgi:DNA-binding MarR family transcriptional regulator
VPKLRGEERDRQLREGSVAYRQYVSAEALSGHATAAAIGLNATDFFCLNLLSLAGALTAGQLAQRTGLTTGAATRMIDRLESAGFVRRDRDPTDRRQVVVQVTGGREKELDAVLEPVRRRMYAVFRRYDSEQVGVLFDYFTHAAPALLAAVEELRHRLPEQVARADQSDRKTLPGTGNQDGRGTATTRLRKPPFTREDA